MPIPVPQDRLGQTLGNYRLTKLLGKGGNAEVYLAEHTLLGLQNAIKVLKTRNLTDLEEAQFRDEAKLMTTLRHPHIVTIFDYDIEVNKTGFDGSTPYLVMEYMPLGTLRHLYPHGTLVPPLTIAAYIKQLAEALQYAHDQSNSIIHRDVKPENILVRRPDDIALSDFGIAIAGHNTMNLTLQMEDFIQKMKRGEKIEVPGTASYIAPERLQGGNQRASDQYSLAVIVYEWLCGQRPFTGSDLEICTKHLADPPPALFPHYSHILPRVAQVVMKALAKKPEDRYPSVLDFATELEKAIGGKPQVPAPSMPFPQPAPVQPPTQRQAPFPAQPPTQRQAPPPVQPPTQRQAPSPAQPSTQRQAPSPVQPSTQTQVPPPQLPGQPLYTGTQRPQASAPQMPWYAQPTPPPFPYADPTIADAGVHIPRQAPPEDSLPSLLHDLIEAINAALATDRYFLKRKRGFRFAGILLNVLSALVILLIGPLPISIVLAIAGGAFSIRMFLSCIISVKKPIAIFFGVSVAMWWGYVIGVIASRTPYIEAPLVGAFLGFIISLAIHIWYVENRLTN
ncbi:MAG: hypothetical protein E6J34_16045 [Chloroflexi bacterium]|nr:MAG: hypothetical protein E6J34_16045 [Chloroflexota bacterium]